jgi:hypothetical protein
MYKTYLQGSSSSNLVLVGRTNRLPQKIGNLLPIYGVRGSAVGWGAALQVGRLRVRFLMSSLEIFIDIILPAPLWPWSWHPLTEMSTRSISGGGLRLLVHRADNLTTFMYWLSSNLGSSTSWNTVGLARPVMGLICYQSVPCNGPE